MSAFAIYRLPHADHVVFVRQTEGEPSEFLSCAELNGREGFVIAPFEAKPGQPICLIRPDRVEFLSDLSALSSLSDCVCVPEISEPSQGKGMSGVLRQSYAIDFANFHAQLLSGAFSKLVLSRRADEWTEALPSPLLLFRRACESYPRMFISLVYTPKSGLWLTATPEILLDGVGDQWRTIALAGTMKLEGEQLAFDTPSPLGENHGESIRWSVKDIQEQRYVATYITECLEQFTGDFQEEGPFTVRAANLVHLRSDFTFSLPDQEHLGDLLQALHPTPAVCGLPKRESFQFITRNEYAPRRYYSGFMGPLNAQWAMPGEHGRPSSAPRRSTHLYVSLRCMNIEGCCCHLYAGGGLLKSSQEELEWQETEAKLETMRGLLVHSS